MVGALGGSGGGDGYEVSMASNKWMRVDGGLDSKKETNGGIWKPLKCNRLVDCAQNSVSLKPA